METHLDRIKESGLNFSIYTDLQHNNSYYCAVGNRKNFKYFKNVNSLHGSFLWIIETVLTKYKNSLFYEYYIMVYNYYADNHVDLNTMTTEFKMKMIDSYSQKNKDAVSWDDFIVKNKKNGKRKFE